MAAAATPRRSRSRRDTGATSSSGAASRCAAASSCSVSRTTASASSIDTSAERAAASSAGAVRAVTPLPDERRRVVQRMHALARGVVDAQFAVDRLHMHGLDVGDDDHDRSLSWRLGPHGQCRRARAPRSPRHLPLAAELVERDRLRHRRLQNRHRVLRIPTRSDSVRHQLTSASRGAQPSRLPARVRLGTTSEE